MCLAGKAAHTYSALGRSGVFHHLASETRVEERGHYKQLGWGFAQDVELSVLKPRQLQEDQDGWSSWLAFIPTILPLASVPKEPCGS